ncbi:MAG TPA: DUF1570 domain-containing protein [Terriglobales bacterium]
MRIRLATAAVLTLSLFSTRPLGSEEKPWTEIRSPHFRLMTNGDEGAARHALLHFETMRAVFESQFPHFKLDSPAPLLILAPRDEGTTKRLLPQMWTHPGPKPAGIYLHGWEREYAIVRLDSIDLDPETYHTVYHEYVHSILHTNFHWLPSWLDEGLADFYGYTYFDKAKMYIGSPPDMGRVRYMDSRPSIPLDQFITSRMFSRDEEQTQLAYMQAWGLTHFLSFGPEMQNGQRLRNFFNELQHGVEQKKAFQETIGTFGDIQKAYDSYIHKLRFTTLVLPLPPKLNEKEFVTRAMSPAETDAELAAWFIRLHRWDEMRAHTEAALKEDPKLSLAQEDAGFLDFNEGRDEKALKEFAAASELDNKNYVALFAETMVSESARSNAPQDQRAVYEKLNQVIDLKSDFAPAYIELAKLNIAQDNLPIALALSRKAVQLEPFRSGYHVLTGRILLRMNRAPEAAAEATYVAQRWGGSDRDEAMELWNQIPEPDRKSDAPMLPESVSKGESAVGIVQSVTCKDSDFAITLDVGGKSQTFKAKGFPVGYSDTLWVGRDHFSPCFHVQGLRAMLRYNAAKDASYVGDLRYVGFRDDLPDLKRPTSEAAAH